MTPTTVSIRLAPEHTPDLPERLPTDAAVILAGVPRRGDELMLGLGRFVVLRVHWRVADVPLIVLGSRPCPEPRGIDLRKPGAGAED